MRLPSFRAYGKRPYGIAVLHGGPGAPGEMASVARELSSSRGVLEPLQTAPSLEGQVQELRTVLEEHANLPVTLIGWSWGAMLGYIFAAEYPSFVAKLILVGSGVYEEKYAAGIMKTRLSRLAEADRTEAVSLMESLDSPAVLDKAKALARFGALMSKADSYDPLPHDSEVLEVQGTVYQNVWSQAVEMRSSGKLLELGERVLCPVVAIHGDYDPHSAEGVRDPLSRVLKDFRFILLEKCGHCPWLERTAKDRFYTTLHDELPDK